LAIKLLNASKFTLGLGSPSGDAEPPPVDAALRSRLRDLVLTATEAFEEFDYARVLERTEAFFWLFCDDYLELVKGRAYGTGPGADSARATLRVALSVLQRLFAPVIPFVTEEVWSWWQEGSVHRSRWPHADEIESASAEDDVLIVASEVLGAIRRAKTESKRSMKAAVESVRVAGPPDTLTAARAVESDLADAGSVAQFAYEDAPELAVAVEFPAESEAYGQVTRR
jgi:valyl-tRNA synthetase